ncbi:MAG: DUF4177 domain-containing protein [Boseongicola sp.]
MINFEYIAVPAPTHGTKAKGVKSTEDRFALAMTDTLNELAADGWDYVRAETLPCEERKGLTGTQTTFQNVLIFRRQLIPEEAAVATRRVASQPLPPLTLERQQVPEPRQAVARMDPPLARAPTPEDAS